MTKKAGSGSISQKHGSADPDPDPPQNVMDPHHCLKEILVANATLFLDSYFIYNIDDGKEHIMNTIFLLEVLYGGCGLDVDLMRLGACL
jgi:hypothetical protein